jgi:hypothetical protein
LEVWLDRLKILRAAPQRMRVAGLQPGNLLAEKADVFRFPGEPAQAGTNMIAGASTFPRELLKTALR